MITIKFILVLNGVSIIAMNDRQDLVDLFDQDLTQSSSGIMANTGQTKCHGFKYH